MSEVAVLRASNAIISPTRGRFERRKSMCVRAFRRHQTGRAGHFIAPDALADGIFAFVTCSVMVIGSTELNIAALHYCNLSSTTSPMGSNMH